MVERIHSPNPAVSERRASLQVFRSCRNMSFFFFFKPGLFSQVLTALNPISNAHRLLFYLRHDNFRQTSLSLGLNHSDNFPQLLLCFRRIALGSCLIRDDKSIREIGRIPVESFRRFFLCISLTDSLGSSKFIKSCAQLSHPFLRFPRRPSHLHHCPSPPRRRRILAFFGAVAVFARFSMWVIFAGRCDDV